MDKPKEPKHFLVFKIVGFSLLLVGITLIILGCVVFRVKFGDGDMPNFALFVPGLFISVFSVPCLFVGFAPKINKMQIDSVKYMQEFNKGNLSDIANTSADISSDALTQVAKSIKKGVKDSKYCKHCGAEIDADSKFCKECGKEQ